jgi:hypothetical protein
MAGLFNSWFALKITPVSIIKQAEAFSAEGY